ncbi:hypothetical protein UlMin_046073 [Ulmus minor]
MANTDQNPNQTSQTSLPRILPPPTNSPSFSMTTYSGILSQTPSVKLDSENYLLWQNMHLPILRGYNLEGLILGTMPCPSATTTVPKVASRAMGHKTSMSLWEAIKNYFGSLKIKEYLNNVKSIADNLFLAGKPVESNDLITQVLAGLDDEYTPIVVQLTSKYPITWEELQSTLITYESQMEQLNAARLSLAAANIMDPAWFIDSGVSNHVTGDMNNLSQAAEYTGKDQLIVGNGMKLGITHIRHTTLPTRTQKQINLKNILHFLKQCNENSSINTKFPFCDACQFGKSHSLPFQFSEKRATKPLQLIHTYLWGPAPVTSSYGFKYYIHFIDDFSRSTWLYPLKHKDKALSTFLQFQKLVENKFERKIKTIQSDWGGEYRSFTKYLIQLGIEFRHPCPHTSAQNGRAKRKHRHIVEIGLTLLAQAHLPLTY